MISLAPTAVVGLRQVSYLFLATFLAPRDIWRTASSLGVNLPSELIFVEDPHASPLDIDGATPLELGKCLVTVTRWRRSRRRCPLAVAPRPNWTDLKEITRQAAADIQEDPRGELIRQPLDRFGHALEHEAHRHTKKAASHRPVSTGRRAVTLDP